MFSNTLLSLIYNPTNAVIKGNNAVNLKIQDIPYFSNKYPDEYDAIIDPNDEDVQHMLCNDPDNSLFLDFVTTIASTNTSEKAIPNEDNVSKNIEIYY